MPVESEKEVAAYLQQTNRRLYDRLFLNRTIAGKITAISGTRPLYLVRIDTTGDAWHACYEPGYTPSIGDTIDLTWRDADTGYVMTPRNAGALTATWMKIGTIALTATIGSIAFNAIPQSFQHLKVLADCQTTDASPRDLQLRYNADSSASYYGGWAWTNSTFAGAASPVAQIQATAGSVSPNASLTNGVSEITIFDYSQSEHRVSATFFSHKFENSTVFTTVFGGFAYAPAVNTPITIVQLFPAAGSFTAGDNFYLYGI